MGGTGERSETSNDEDNVRRKPRLSSLCISIIRYQGLDSDPRHLNVTSIIVMTLLFSELGVAVSRIFAVPSACSIALLPLSYSLIRTDAHLCTKNRY